MCAKSTRSVKSVETTAEIVDAIRRMHGGGVSDLADRVGLSPGAVHTHLSTLEDVGYVVKQDGTYHLGPEFLALGEAVRYNHPLFQAGRDEVDKIAVEVGECVHLVVENQGRLYAVYEQFGDDAVGAEYHNRKRQQSFPPHSTAAGKAILAAEDPARTEKILSAANLEPQTKHTLTSEAELYDDLEDVKERGYATVDEEQMNGIRAVSAPVFDGDDVLGAVAISGPVSKFQGEFFQEELPEMVMRVKEVCEVNLQASTLS